MQVGRDDDQPIQGYQAQRSAGLWGCPGDPSLPTHPAYTQVSSVQYDNLLISVGKKVKE